jgi:hypothetical protein
MKERKVTFSLRNLNRKTPKILFRIGNTLLTLSTFVTGYEFYQNDTKMALYSLAAGVIGKTLTELFGSPNQD